MMFSLFWLLILGVLALVLVGMTIAVIAGLSRRGHGQPRLIGCPECGRNLLPEVKSCPHCGHAMTGP